MAGVSFAAVRGLAELSRSLEVSDRGRNTQKPVRNRSESVCAGLWAPLQVFLAWFRPVWGPNVAPSRRFPAEFLKMFGALLAQPRWDTQQGPMIIDPKPRVDEEKITKMC